MNNKEREARVPYAEYKNKTNGRLCLARVNKAFLVHAQYSDNYEGFTMPKTMFKENFVKVKNES